MYLVAGGPAEYDLAALVQALLRVGETSCLPRLTSYIREQPEQALRTLEKIIAKQPGIPEPFRQAVGDAVVALPPRRTGFLAQLLNR